MYGILCHLYKKIKNIIIDFLKKIELKICKIISQLLLFIYHTMLSYIKKLYNLGSNNGDARKSNTYKS
jgi:hypothetical protein